MLDRIFAESSPARLWNAAFRTPVSAEPVSSFGKRSIVNGKPGNPHAGTDFNAPAGAAVRAPNGGKVVLADDLYFSGLTAVVDHGLGLYSLFAHLSRTEVGAGQGVKARTRLGLVGSTGRSTGPHLHWSVRLAGTRVDPLSLIAVTRPPAPAVSQSGNGHTPTSRGTRRRP